MAAVPALERIVADGHRVVEVWTQPDRPSGRGRRMTAPPVKVAAEKIGIEVFQPEKIKTQTARDRFKGLSADVAVVVAYGKILPSSYLEAFPMGAINVHFSLLPKYRGAAPVNWAIVNGDKISGVTTMKMNEGMDTGDILLQTEVVIGANENSIELTERLAQAGADLISRTLSEYERIEPLVQDEKAATYAPMLKKQDGRIDWNLGAFEIVNRIRGFQPFPKSYSEIKDTQITFWDAKVVGGSAGCEPGEIIGSEGSELVICCGSSSAIEVRELQAAGKARIGARDFLNSGLLATGDRFEH